MPVVPSLERRVEELEATCRRQQELIDALRPHGIHHVDFPYSPARIWQAIVSGSRT